MILWAVPEKIMLKPAIYAFLFSSLMGVTMAAPPTDQWPQAQITNGDITAKLYLPDAETGYYRGTRFDWSGVIYSLKTKNHEYFGQWFERYDPKLHDAIMGPVQEFHHGDTCLGYDEAKVGGTFIRIGVGVLRKPDERQFNRFKTYEIVDPGKWSVVTGKDKIMFVHDLNDGNGYAYRYTKTVLLVPGKPIMVLEQSLKNLGTKPIHTQQYDHNFFVMDGQPTGPDASVKFPFELKPVHAFQGGLAQANGSEINYLKELEKGQSVFGEYSGFGATTSDYDIRMEHRKAGAGVRITGSQALVRLIYWSIRTTFCPEPYVAVDVEPGRNIGWRYTYEFYDLPAAPAK